MEQIVETLKSITADLKEDNDKYEEKQNANKHLEDLYNQALKDYDELQERIYKAIKMLESNDNYDENGEPIYKGKKELLEILKGIK